MTRIEELIEKVKNKSSAESEAIEVAVKVAKRRLARLNALRDIGAITRAQEFERDMTVDCINRGEKMLGRTVEQ